jgi:hypothetical protein
MATPPLAYYAAALLDFAGLTISQLVRERVATDQKLLDIGPGWGKYRFLLPEYEMDGVEVWKPYVAQNKLDAYYSTVHVVNAVDFRYLQRYGAVIIGDVLEHIPVEGAQAVIRAACANADHLFVAVPFEMPQDEVEGNHHEAHAQDDLTAELMAERYPELQFYGVFQRPEEHAKAIYVKAQ